MRRQHALIIFGFFIFFSTSSFAKFRAREHYDVFSLRHDGQSYTYRGLSNTINYFWKEVAMDESVGLGFSSLGNNVSNDDLLGSPFGRSLNLFQVDFEYKHFPFESMSALYLRYGSGLSYLDSGFESLMGVHLQQAIGLEIPLKYLGLALEVEAQEVFLESGVNLYGVGMALGLHFYKFF
jgi:hypothetical protein